MAVLIDRSFAMPSLFGSIYDPLPWALLAPRPAPKPKVWRATVDVSGYSRSEVSATVEGKNIVVSGLSERELPHEGDFDRREMRQTVTVPDVVPLDRCELSTEVICGRLVIELKEKVQAKKEESAESQGCPKDGVVSKVSPGDSTAAGIISAVSGQWSLNDNEYRMGCNLSGFSPESVDVKVDEDSKTVTVRAEEKSEGSYRSFRKTVTVPSDMQLDSLKSSFSEGQLMVAAEKAVSKMEEDSSSSSSSSE